MTAKSREKFRCPRRPEVGSMVLWGDDTGEANDTWRKGFGMVGYGGLTCTGCGSMHPDDFMNTARGSVEIGPTDKNYKAYVNNMESKFYYQHLSQEQREAMVELWNAGILKLGYPGYFYVLPYFMRLVPKDES